MHQLDVLERVALRELALFNGYTVNKAAFADILAVAYQELESEDDIFVNNDFSQEQRIKFVDEASKILITINELKAKDDKRKRNETIILFGISVAVAAVSIATNIFVSKFQQLKIKK